jgi:hypothetical protein
LHSISLKIENQDITSDGIGCIFEQSPRSISSWVKRSKKAGIIEKMKSGEFEEGVKKV